MSNNSRRDFLKKSSLFVTGAAVLGSAGVLTGCSESEPEVPAYPYAYKELDLDRVEKLAYEGYFEDGCCYGVAYALLTELQEKVGYPYTVIPAAMFANGKEGYTSGTLCGALGGAVGIIGLCCAPADSREIVKKLFAWYTSTPLPIYQPEAAAPVQTVSTTANCLDSITIFMNAANVERKDPIRKRRCGGLSGDVARKTAELLNIHFGYAKDTSTDTNNDSGNTGLAANEYLGEADGYGGKIQVKVTMDGKNIKNIEVLSHGETAGISDPAFTTIPDAIIKAQSADVDVVSNATYTSNGLINAVKDALSKVK